MAHHHQDPYFFDIDQVERDIDKALSVMEFLRDDLEKCSVEGAHPLHLMKSAELLRSCANSVSGFLRLLDDHMKLFPEVFIERKKALFEKLNREDFSRSSFRRN